MEKKEFPKWVFPKMADKEKSKSAAELVNNKKELEKLHGEWFDSPDSRRAEKVK